MVCGVSVDRGGAEIHAGAGVPSVVTGSLWTVSRPLKSVVLGSPLRVMPAAAPSARVSLLIDVEGSRRAARPLSRLAVIAASGGGA